MQTNARSPATAVDAARPLMRLLVCGSVEGASILDALGAQCEGGEPIDAGRRSFSSATRRFIVADPPGLEDYTRNMAIGASIADVAIVVVDARKGLLVETPRHGFIAALLGVRRIVLVVDSMGLVDYSPAVFAAIEAAYRAFARQITLPDVAAIPISAAHGDNVIEPCASMPWYRGPTLMAHLDTVPIDNGSLGADAPVEIADQFEASIVWLDVAPLLRGRSYLMKIATATVNATVAPLKYRLDVHSLEHVAADKLERNEIGVGNIELDRPITFLPYAIRRELGGFILIDGTTGDTVGAGQLRFALRRSHNIHRQPFDIDRSARATQKSQRPCVLWLTGISGAGKSTIANRVETKLHALGRHTYVLDGDNVRKSLNKDLGFTAADRVENIRRVAEVAALMADAGLIVIVALISPFRDERSMARSLLPNGDFVEIFVDTPLAVAEERDAKGLYRKARRGDLANFTGVDSPYEVPENAEITIDGAHVDPDTAADRIIESLRQRAIITA
jgi:bifunctional enzyme CysN/CysC